MISRVFLAAAMLLGRVAAAQLPVVVRDAGPGPVGRQLEAILAKPDTRVIVGDSLTLPRDSVFSGSLVVIGPRVVMHGRVGGDLVVVGGDLVMKPGARIDGEGIAIGGGAYPSLLASVPRLTSHRDITFDATRGPSSIELRYRELAVGVRRSIFELPGIWGLRIPSYDRSNGLSIPAGATATLLEGRLTFDGLLTYRSQIGQLDPSIVSEWKTGRKFWLSGWVGRETRSNDDWITGDLSNSLNVLLTGQDTRNWYRARAVNVTANRLFETVTLASVYRAGVQLERSSRIRPDSFAGGGPWSILGRKSLEGIRRPNPQTPAGELASAIVGANYRWTAGDVKARLDGQVETPWTSGSRFIQGTVDGQITFPTFGRQHFKFETHAILTRAGSATVPAQRYGYIGGHGTISTDDLLSTGGDQLLFFESRYEIPLERVILPVVGSPTIMLRHILGSAGVGSLPDFTQVVGLRVSIPFARVQVLIDTRERKPEFSAGLSLTR